MKQPHKFPSFPLNFLISVMISLLSLPATAGTYGIHLKQEAETPADAALKAQAEQLSKDAFSLSLKGDLTAAVEKFKQAYELSKRAKNPRGEARALYNIGSTYSSLGQQHKTEALDYLNRALSIWQALADHGEEGKTLATIGLIYYRSNEKKKAVKYFEEAKPIVSEAWKRDNEIILLTAMGLSYLAVSESQKALDTFLELLPLMQATDYRPQTATVTMHIALLYESMGVTAKAFDYAKQARQLWRVISDNVKEADALKVMGTLSDTLGNYKAAFTYLSEALSLLAAPGDHSKKADMLDYLGWHYSSWGNYQKSLEYFQQALGLRRSGGPRGNEASTLYNMALSYMMLDRDDLALERMTEALRLFRDAKDLPGEMKVLYDIGTVYSRSNDNQNAVDSLEKALPIAQTIGDRVRESLILLRLGNIYNKLGEKQKALKNLQQAVALSKDVVDLRFKAHLLAHIGISYLSLRDYQQALDYNNRALDLYRAQNNIEGISLALTNIAVVQDIRGDSKQAINLYLQAIKVREQMRISARLEEIQLGFAVESSSVYRQVIDFCMRKRLFPEAFDLSERARARSFLDQLGNVNIDLRQGADPVLIEQERTLRVALNKLEKRLREEQAKPLPLINVEMVRLLQAQLLTKQQEYAGLRTRIRAVNPEYDSLRNINPLTLAEVQRLLDQDTTLISYFITPDKTTAFIITRDSFRALEIPVSEAELKREVSLFYDSRSNLNDSQPRSLKQLYARLVEPLKPYLKTRILGIIPHSVLHYLPFAALNDGQNYFGDRYTLFYLPSASIIPFVQKKRKQGEQYLLALAQDRAESLPLLAYANQSAETIAKLYNTTALIGSAATESAFRSRASTSRTLFLAAHGAMSRSSPLFSRIFLAPDSENDGILEVHEVYDLDLAKADLVVLSACQTQLGEHSQGDDIIGLNRAFIYAGTPTIVASLWSVQDKQTGELMVSFFKQLKGGKSKAEALQAAQREMRAKYPHPYYWAAFVLTGEP